MTCVSLGFQEMSPNPAPALPGSGGSLMAKKVGLRGHPRLETQSSGPATPATLLPRTCALACPGGTMPRERTPRASSRLVEMAHAGGPSQEASADPGQSASLDPLPPPAQESFPSLAGLGSSHVVWSLQLPPGWEEPEGRGALWLWPLGGGGRLLKWVSWLRRRGFQGGSPSPCVLGKGSLASALPRTPGVGQRPTSQDLERKRLGHS